MSHFSKMLKVYLRKGSPLLLILRAPSRIFNFVLVLLNTTYWKFFLGECGKNVRIDRGVLIDIPKNVYLGDNVVIGKNVRIGAENTVGTLRLAKNVQINRDCVLDHSGNVVIGENSLVSAETLILSHSHGYNPRSKSIGLDKIIGRGVWIGIRSTVSENAKVIADDVIIASGAVVTKNCDRINGIYGGVPAKLIKEIPSVA